MQILCVGGAFVPIASFYSNFLISQGRSNVFLWNTIGLCLLQMAALLLLYPYGVETMVTVYVILGILWLPVWHFFVERLIGLRLWQATFFASIYVAIIVKIAVALAVYVGMMLALRVVVFRECVEFLLSRFKKK